jgi:hypothetical protein
VGNARGTQRKLQVLGDSSVLFWALGVVSVLRAFCQSITDRLIPKELPDLDRLE